MIVNLLDIQGISLMGSAGFLIVFTAVNLAAARLPNIGPAARTATRCGVAACAGCLAALGVDAAADIPAQLAVLGAMLAIAILAETAIRARGRTLPPDATAHTPGRAQEP